MSIQKPDPKVRLAVVSWPDESPRGAITAFCRKHGVSTSWFYKVRARARREGQWPAMELETTRPKTSPRATSAEMVRLALEVRSELQDRGYDYGPLSVAAKLRRRGLQPPSRATLARIFAHAGVVVPEPKKRPRSSYRRFVYPAPNCLWQIDATEWPLAYGRTAIIFQLLDDHSRLALASLAAPGETSKAAIQLVNIAIDRHGVPQKFLSDNGTALNPSRRGWIGKLVTYLKSFGVTPITGKPAKPTTQGKNERFHRTLHKYLEKQPPTATLDDLQAQIDDFDAYYNTERENQALPPGTTPHEAWNATPIAPAPTPPAQQTTPEWTQTRRLANPRGIVEIHTTKYMLGKPHARQTIHILYDTHTITFYDPHGTEIISHPIPTKHTKYVGNGQPRGFMANHNNHEVPRHQKSTNSRDMNSPRTPET